MYMYIQILNENDTLCAIVGGFNARSSDFHDFIIPDDDLWSFFNYNTDDAISAELYDFQKLISYDIPLHRKSNNKGRCNAYDNKLLNMCKNNNMHIANGRVSNDKNICKVTSKESSTVDYLIIVSGLFPFITYLVQIKAFLDDQYDRK